MQQPRHGFDDPFLAQLFEARTDQEDSATQHLINVGGIAGGVIGGVAGLAAVAGSLWWYRRRKRVAQDSEPASDATHGSGPAPSQLTNELVDFERSL